MQRGSSPPLINDVLACDPNKSLLQSTELSLCPCRAFDDIEVQESQGVHHGDCPLVGKGQIQSVVSLTFGRIEIAILALCIEIAVLKRKSSCTSMNAERLAQA